MQPKYILIAGSAASDCPSEKLERAHEFVAMVTEEILRTGNGVTVLASQEPASNDAAPAIFDWTVLRSVAQFRDDSYGNADRVLARVITGADSFTKRFSAENAQLVQRLQEKGAIQVHHKEERLYSGGGYREQQANLSDALIAVGGGKGTYIIGDLMLSDGKPVIPMDIAIGSRNSDGGGALDLLSEMKTNQRIFLPHGHEAVNSQIYALSLERPIGNIRRIATAVAQILAVELESDDSDNDKTDSDKGGLLKRLAEKTPAAAQSAYYLARIAEILSRLAN